MRDTQKRIRDAVTVYLALNRVRQEDLAPQLGMTQQRLSERLTGRTRWSLDDVLALAALGVIPSDFTPLVEAGATDGGESE